MTIYDILAKFRTASTEVQKGAAFEKLMLRWLKADPVYSQMFTEVWMWHDFPFRNDFGGVDLGIDLVAKDDKGGYWAIQCKCYDEKTVIQKSAVDSFISNSSRTFKDENLNTVTFSGRMWISTTNKYGKNAEQTFENQMPAVTRVNLRTLDESQVDWELLVNGKNGTDALRKKAEPRKYQEEIIASALHHFKSNERGTLVMACGTGKTLTSLFIAQDMLQNKGLVLFLAPSIALVGQSLNSWFANSAKPIKAICVCSDNTAGSLNSDDEEDYMRESLTDLPIRSCTNPDTVVKEIERYKDHDGLLICFSTYQSIEVVSEAQQLLLQKHDNQFGRFNLVICDEAHRTASVTCKDRTDSVFALVHKDSVIKADHRLYMTATPKIYNEASKTKAALKDDELYSMDREEIFGKHFYTLGFGTAVQQGLLTDYKVLVLTIDQSQASTEFLNAYKAFIDRKNADRDADDQIHHITPEQQAMILGSVSALSKQVLFTNKDDFAEDEDMKKPMHTAIAFCDNVRRYKKTKDDVYVAQEISYAFEEVPAVYKEFFSSADVESDDDFIKNLVNVKANMVSGDMPSNERNKNLDILRDKEIPNDECHVVCNVNCLSEGVDVPALDAAVFLAAKSSMVTIVQSVGRVMRKFAGKKYGYIIVPVVIPMGADASSELDKNDRYKKVWTILNAMRSHDERLAAELSNHNYTHVKVSKPRPPRPGGGGGNGGGGNGGPRGGDGPGGIIEFPPDFVEKLYARMVDKVGERFYWEKWSKKVGDVAQNFITRLNDLISEGKYVNEIDNFVASLQKNINPSIDRDQAITFLAQQLITKPVFEALFPEYDFTKNNNVSRSIQKVLDSLQDEAFIEDRQVLKSFYDNVSQVCGSLRTSEEKQDTIKTLYEKFFKGAFPKTVEQLGIVYTPVECVDFIIRSVDEVLKREFGLSLKDQGVNILDPFTGTGTFITRLLQYLRKHGISFDDLYAKYKNEIYCNEIVLLAYYVADVNIETTFNDMMASEEYVPYNNICLTDTFQLAEDPSRLRNGDNSPFFKENLEQVKQQQRLPIRVIFGNPPYSIGQKSANDNAQNMHYPVLDDRIAKTYGANSSANLQKSLYDSYIKAFRWASDRIHENDNTGGIVAFISNGSWLDGNAQDGFRKCVEKEFTDIYVFNLRGNQRTSGELSRKEGGKIFGSGSRTPVAITLLVCNPAKKVDGGKATIHYLDIGDYLSQQEKLDKIKKIGSVLSKDFGDNIITPNEHGDWISMRNEGFSELIPINPDKNFTESKTSFFTAQAIGVATNRDAWDYNYSLSALKANIKTTVDFFDQQREEFAEAKKADDSIKVEDFVDSNKTKIAWTRSLRRYCEKNTSIYADAKDYVVSSYRPYQKMNLLYNSFLVESPGQWGKLFPSDNHKNLVICVNGIGCNKNFSCLISDKITCLDFVEKNQSFPLYYYESKEDFKKRTKTNIEAAPTLDFGEDFTNYDKFGFDEYGYIRHDGITDYILKEIKSRYKLPANSQDISKEDVFYYVYGILHSPVYRQTFEADLKISLPRIPIVDSPADFRAFKEAGRELAHLHLNYETVAPHPAVKVDIRKEDFTVTKMRFLSKDDKSTILYNDHITISNIPAEAYDYIVNGKSAIEWILERYCVSTDKESLIKNDCNDWAKEHNQPRYILDLLLSVINVSTQTVEIVNNLPKLNL